MSIPGGASESSCGIFPSKFTNTIRLGGLLAVLALALGCGSNGTSNGTGPFSTGSLSGSYVCRLSGNDSFIDASNNLQTEGYTETLVFTADGSGRLSGTEDFNSTLPAIGFTGGTAFTGTYSIGRDGNGSMTINFSAPSSGQINLSITLASTSKFYAVEADAFANFSANAAGEGVKQTTSTFAAAPTGTFVTRVHQAFPTTVSSSTVGALTSTNGTSVTGTVDILLNDTLLPQVTLTAGSFSAPDSNGRGTLVYTDSASAVPTHYQYYEIDANTFWLMESDSTVLGTGSAEMQASGTLTLAGNYAFGSSGDTDSFIGGVRSVGVFTAGGGAITGGVLDSVQDGVSTLNQDFTGTYTPAANGRVDVSLTPSGGAPIPEVFWMVSPSRAFFLVAATNKAEDGTIDLQQQDTFAATDLKGQYALVMDGYNPSNLLTRIGTLISDGNGNLQLNEEANSFVLGSLPGLINDPPTLSGNYTVDANGRVAAALSTLSSNLVMYMVSPGEAYILQNDPGVEISGKITLQSSP
ncbi:MAG: hypothetical protein WA628_17790 [Terriglobales bacterium]